MSKKTDLLGKVGLGRMSVAEYQANLNGINMFFGAVLGLVLTGTEQLNSWQFGVVLTCLASVVITILYISSSSKRVAYSIYAMFLSATFPDMMNHILKTPGLVPDKIRPTLIVWTLMTILVEFWARDREAPKPAPLPGPPVS